MQRSSRSLLGAVLQHGRAGLSTSCRTASAEAGAATSAQDAALPYAQSKALSAALRKLQAPLQAATRLATLTAMSALYRDIHLTASSIHHRQAYNLQDPLTDPVPASTKAPATSAAPLSFPLRDVTQLPDSEAPPMRLDQRHMDKITCWAALQPSHIETSSMLLTGINLFPPQEAAYPTYVDWDAVVKGLEQRKSRKRLRTLSRLRKRQDKYQLRIWDHHPGEF